MWTLNFFSYGGDERLKAYIADMQERMRKFIEQNNIHLYSSSVLDTAEFKPEKLKTRSRLSLPVKDGSYKTYEGYAEPVDYDALHQKLYSSRGFGGFLQAIAGSLRPCPKYSRSQLMEFIREPQSLSGKNIIPETSDFELEYNYDRVDQENDLCVIKVTLNDIFKPLEVFKSLSEAADSAYSDVFASAYAEDKSITNFGIFIASPKYDNRMLGSKIVSIGYAFYICDRIKKLNGIPDALELVSYDADKLANGTYYKFRESPDRFGASSISQDLRVFGKAVVPNCFSTDWNTLCRIGECSTLPVFDCISVYQPVFCSQRGNLTILFSFGYDSFESIEACHPMEKCIERIKV